MIEVRFDPTLDLPDIKMPIYSENPDSDPNALEHDPGYVSEDSAIIDQTKLDGVMVPLVRICNQTVFFTEIVDMHLYIDKIPKLDITIDDQLGLIKNLDTPSWDNSLQLQILPPFEGAYKKINLLFYVESVNIEGSIITMSATYHVPNFWDHRMEAYGEITTYEYMEAVAREFKLGFASNITSTDDKRYIYNPMMNQVDHIDNTVSYAHNSAKESIFDWWIDYWNHLVLIDKYTEYNEKLPEDKMQIWTVDNKSSIGGDDNTRIPVKMLAVFTNSPILEYSQMHIDGYTPEYSATNVTDQIFDTYSMDTLEQTTTLIENGDAKDNLQKKYIYGGEYFGDYDYLARRETANMLIAKINAQTIRVSIRIPTLGLIKGGKANLWWYDENNYVTGPIMEESNENIESNIELPESIIVDEGGWIINKTVSGQYYINDMSFRYHTQFQWMQEFVLSRDGNDIEKYNPPIKEESEKN